MLYLNMFHIPLSYILIFPHPRHLFAFPAPPQKEEVMICFCPCSSHGLPCVFPKSAAGPLAGELLDVSTGRDMYGPQGGYALLAGHDVTRCLATMSLEPRHWRSWGWEG